jgi:hypothetical protein
LLARPERLTVKPGGTVMKLPRCVPTVEEAVALIRDHHAAWMATAASDVH